jgi:hypothetical protein
MAEKKKIANFLNKKIALHEKCLRKIDAIKKHFNYEI